MAQLEAEIVARFNDVIKELDKVESGATAVEKQFLKLQGTTIEFDKVTKTFQKTLTDGKDVMRTTIDAQEGLNAIGIKTSAQFKDQISVLLQLRKAYQADAAVVAQLDRQLETLGAGLGRANKSARGSSQVFFQAGQAVSDFASAGILGAANNLEVLALQLGASGPVLIGLSALAAAAIVFKDDISAAFSGLDEELVSLQDNTKNLADELIRIKDGLKITFEGTLEELEADGKRVDTIVERLEERARNLRGAIGTATTSRGPGGATFNALGDTKALQEELDGVLRVLARQKGIQESINASVEDQKLLQELINDLEGTNLTKKEEQVKKEKEKQTLLERAIESNSKLNEQLEALRNVDQSRLGQILFQNEALRDQIKIVQRIAEEQAKAARIAGSSLGGFTALDPAGLSQDGLPTFKDTLEGIAKRKRKDRGRLLEPAVLLPDSVVKEVEDQQKRQRDAMRETQQQAEQLANAIEGGLTGAITGFAQAIGSGEDPFTALRNQVGDFATDLGKAFIAFGVAGLSLKSFLTNPATAIIAGSGLVVLGSALKKAAEGKVDSITGSAGSSTSPVPIADPRQGRDGRFRRGQQDFQSGFSFLPPKDFGVNSSYTFRIEGTDLVAVKDTTERRQARTIGAG